ncbi:MAG TPA: tRNA preQ1(34) S-adenosylmethionine ribosyltransferase-isomerase QueA [Gammaproteobacteria bacterium]|nr:tRNA preQ1(34) S-adenosylmethionine ribosyltransferase-isomerase QueA [Gammaproteobacteria bacterium]
MQRSDFAFELPRELIAQRPLPRRSASRMLCLDGGSGRFEDALIDELPARLRPGDLLVFNDTRVIPARLLGRKASGGAVEVLVDRVLADAGVLAHVRASHAPRAGSELHLADDALTAVVDGREADLFRLYFRGLESSDAVMEALERHGAVPLPPYIKRVADADDAGRYQTVFARRRGAAAAPTAGLHFDDELLAALDRRGVEFAFVTLHVGAGTFQPVREDEVERHAMHAEWLEVGEPLVRRVQSVRAAGGRVVAVGTTVVRSLETATRNGTLEPFRGESRLFIYPGFRFRVIDAMVTNFHLPESTLLMLVCAFAGRENVLAAYRHAVDARYRFFSYGDAMLAWPQPGAVAP